MALWVESWQQTRLEQRDYDGRDESIASQQVDKSSIKRSRNNSSVESDCDRHNEALSAHPPRNAVSVVAGNQPMLHNKRDLRVVQWRASRECLLHAPDGIFLLQPLDGTRKTCRAGWLCWQCSSAANRRGGKQDKPMSFDYWRHRYVMCCAH